MSLEKFQRHDWESNKRLKYDSTIQKSNNQNKTVWDIVKWKLAQ
jgi:hypothetical protein